MVGRRPNDDDFGPFYDPFGSYEINDYSWDYDVLTLDDGGQSECAGVSQSDPYHGNEHDTLPTNVDEIRSLVRLFDSLYGSTIQSSELELGSLLYLPRGGTSLLLSEARSGSSTAIQPGDLINSIPYGSIDFGTVHSHPNSVYNYASSSASGNISGGDLNFQATVAGTWAGGTNGITQVLFSSSLLQYISSPGNATVEYSVDDAKRKDHLGGQVIAGTTGSHLSGMGCV